MSNGSTSVPRKISPIPRPTSTLIFVMCPAMPMTKPASMRPMNGHGLEPNSGLGSGIQFARMSAMRRATVLSGVLVGVLWLVPVEHAKTWDVVFSGSGTSTARYHSDEWDRARPGGETRCEQPEQDYTESATFSWTY